VGIRNCHDIINSIDDLEHSLMTGFYIAVLPTTRLLYHSEDGKMVPQPLHGENFGSRANEMAGARKAAYMLPQRMYLAQQLDSHVSQHDASTYVAGVVNPAASMRVPVQ
jgi:hypothetical protein